jgi:hypothetical protein
MQVFFAFYISSLVLLGVRVRVMVLNAAFNNISVISWWSILLVEETIENHRPTARLELTTLVVINIDCIGSCKSNYHRITTSVIKWEAIQLVNLHNAMNNEFQHIWNFEFVCLSRVHVSFVCCRIIHIYLQFTC